MTGRFCAICGSAASVPPSGPPPAPPPASAGPDLPENLACALTYALGPLTGVLFLVLEPHNHNPRVKFHAFQSLFASAALFVLWFALLIVSGILAFLPIIGLLFGSLLLGFFALGWLVLWVVLMLKAYQGERWKLPVIGDLAEKRSYTN